MLNFSKHLKLFILFFSLITVNITVTYAKAPLKKYPTIEAFLADQKVIRVASDDTSGYGNQAASASLMTRLRQMGFKGKFEFIYANLTTDKIINLFHLPKDISDIYFDTKNNVEFIKLKKFVELHKSKTNPIYALGMVGGGEEFSCHLAEADGIDIKQGMQKIDCDNDANFLDVQTYVAIPSYYEDSNYLAKLNDSDPKPFRPQEKSDNKFFVMPVANISQVKNYLNNDIQGQNLLKNKPALSILIAVMENQKFNVLPVYGYTVQMKICEKLGYGEPGCFPGNILQIIAGARYAQLNGPARFHKPLIIPVFYDYTKESAKLLELIRNENWGEYEKTGAQQARNVLKELGIASALLIADISDFDTIQKIQNLKPGQILLLSMGPLPKIVFDGMYNYTGDNIWPQIREGASSFNSLVLTGKPHFRCENDWEVGFDYITDPVFKTKLQDFYENKKFCRGSSTWAKNSDVYKILGSFIIDSGDPKSAISLYFKFLAKEALKPENDRIRYALLEVIKIINSN